MSTVLLDKNLFLCVFIGGYVWAYNTQPYFESIGQTSTEIGRYMSWIPLVAGSIGVVFGGFISDRIVKQRGLHARVLVLISSQVIFAKNTVTDFLARLKQWHWHLLSIHLSQ